MKFTILVFALLLITSLSIIPFSNGLSAESVTWNSDSYMIGNTGYITVNDPDSNTSELFYDFVTINVSSSSGGKISFMLVETGANTGVFSGDIVFGDYTGEGKETASIKVSEGDKVFATFGKLQDVAQIKILLSPADSISLIQEPSPVLTNNIKILKGASIPGCEEDFTCFSPYSISINPMQIVVWENLDSATHSIKSGTRIEGSDGLFEQTNFYSGDKFTYIFKEEGTFHYYCWIHPWMDGNIIVKSKSADTINKVSEFSSVEFPKWFKLVTMWLNEGKISEQDYQNAIEYLFPEKTTIDTSSMTNLESTQISEKIAEPQIQDVTEANLRSLFPYPNEYGSDWQGRSLDVIENSGYQQLKNQAYSDWVEARVNIHLYYDEEYALQHYEDLIYTIPSYGSPISKLPKEQTCYGYEEFVTYGVTTILFCTYENILVEINITSGDSAYPDSTNDALIFEKEIRKKLG